MTYKEALDLFGLRDGASHGELSKIYKSLIRKWHPDLSDSDNAAEMSRKIIEAYNILLNGGTANAQEDLKHGFTSYTHESIFKIVKA